MATGISPTPEASEHTSVKARVVHVQQQGRVADLQAAKQGSVSGTRASKKLEEALWLIPIEDRRRLEQTLVYAMEPAESALLSGEEACCHWIEASPADSFQRYYVTCG